VLLWAGVAAVAAWHPFDATIDVGEVGGKVRDLLEDPWQAGAFADEGADLLRYVLLGASAVIVARRWSIARPALVGGLLTALFGCMLEASQLFIDSRAPGGKDAVVAASGAFLGALLLARQRAWPIHSSATAVIVAGCLAASLIVLSPYVFSSERRPMESVPFAGYIGPQPERTVSHAVELTLAFFPVGFALAFLARGRYRWMLIGAVAVVSGGTLEYLQGWIVGRYPDVTDVGMLVMGALAGAWAAFPLLPVRPPTL
jgi:VanZ family protein